MIILCSSGLSLPRFLRGQTWVPLLYEYNLPQVQWIMHANMMRKSTEPIMEDKIGRRRGWNVIP